MRDRHQHCPCNGVWLCRACHEWAHAHPFEARGEGIIVSRVVEEPFAVLATAYYGPVFLRCSGTFDLPPEEEEEHDHEPIQLADRRAGDD